MSWETMLPDTAKALSAPITKLVKVVADGCGTLYEPTGIRRKAEAEGDAMVLIEEAKARASEISIRAAHRILDLEERRQRNIDAITARAGHLLPGNVSDSPVSADWAVRFFAECQDIGDEEMRTVWAKVLAGEVAKPGSFSSRTLTVLKNVSREEAQAFNTLCKVSFHGETDADIYPFYDSIGRAPYWEGLGLAFAMMQMLQDAGLLLHHWEASSMYVDLKRRGPVLIRAPRQAFLVSFGGADEQLFMGTADLTTAGRELARICEWDVPADRVAQLNYAYPCQVREVAVDERDGRWSARSPGTE